MLCVLGTVVFAATTAARPRDVVVLAVTFAAGVVLFSPDRQPDAALLGGFAALAALIAVLRPRFGVLGAAAGGVLSAGAATLLELQGVPGAIGLASGALLIAVPAWLVGRTREFAPPALCDEALLAIAVLASGVAILPAVLDGWQAATNLAATSDRAISAGVPIWTVALLSSSAILGAVFSLWSHR
jgi:hypothetical protein